MPDSPPLPLSRFKVLDLTRVRAGPTAVRQLADWGAEVIKIEAPPGPGEGLGGPRHGPDFQNLHRNKRSLTLDLKAPEGIEIFRKLVRERRCRGRELPARRENPPWHRLRGAEGDQPAPGLRQYLRFRAERAVSRPPGFRPDRAGNGRADVDYRPAGARAGARRHPGRRSLGRDLLRDGHPRRAAWSAKFRARANGSKARCWRRRSRCSISRPRAG